jgi:hypothetical protein
LKQLDRFIGSLPLALVHMGTRPFIEARQREGVKTTTTINLAPGSRSCRRSSCCRSGMRSLGADGALQGQHRLSGW